MLRTSVLALLATLCGTTAALAQDIPACALSGSMTVMIGGKPALRLSDVANCPPELYETITSIMIDGQPVVHFKTGVAGKTRCAAKANPTVSMEGHDAQTLGDISCQSD
jgi:uncharacterized Zn-binding protein involved in type VI secretion